MNKWKLLPSMAVKGVVQNKTVYFPYLAVGAFSAFTYFIFSSIIYNEELIRELPKAAYAWMLLRIGRGLLGIILIPFLYYANSFLVKRRSREFGLYSILGLEKRHIGILLFLETIMIYVIVTASGILLGSVLSKLFFLLLLHVTHLPLNVEFVFTWKAFKDTLSFFSVVFLINLCFGLIQIRRSRPVELLSGSKKGEKQPKGIFFYGISGAAVLILGYKISISSELNSMIFTDFFLAVFLVVVGTYLLFTSGSIMLLRILKGNKKFFYQSKNFVTISGMLYRMKKNAASLANICIFSTMVIITLICTITLYCGLDGIIHHDYPYDIRADYGTVSLIKEDVEKQVSRLEEKYGIKRLRVDVFNFRRFPCSKDENSFAPKLPDGNFENTYGVYFLTLEDYNRLENEKKTLNDGEVLFLATGEDFGYDSVSFMGSQMRIAEEIKQLFPFPKAGRSDFGAEFVFIVKDKAALDGCVEAFARENGVTEIEEFLAEVSQQVGIVLEGEDELKGDFADELFLWLKGQEGYTSCLDGLAQRAELESMYGGLLFIGIIFGTVFFTCLLLIMYYKQISEGYEDKGSFDIMQKVGMSDREIKGTIHRQILLVFLLPLAGAISHTCAGMFMVNNLMAALGLFDNLLMAMGMIFVSLLFVFAYGISYVMTARTYYRIVRQDI